MQSHPPSRRSVVAAAGFAPWLVAPDCGPTGPAGAASAKHAPAATYAAGGKYSIRYVSFDDLAPPYLTLTESWNALGMDDQDRPSTRTR